LAGLFVSSLLGMLGTVCAIRRRIRVFVTPNLKRICKGDFSAIAAATATRRVNHAIFVLLTSIFVPILTAGALMAMLGVTGKGPNAPLSTMESAGLGLLLFGPIAAAPAYADLAARIAAPTARECWPQISPQQD
jgi:hypothetical protein